MSETPWQDLRVGDTDRESALRSLGEHMGAGRLTVDEYGDRSAHVATAKTRGELAAVFSDLPEPRPRFGPVAPPPVAYPTHAYPPPMRRPTAGQQLMAFAPVAVGVVLLAVVVFGFRVFSPFMLVPLVFLFVAARRRRWH